MVGKKANLFIPGDHASTFGGNPFACTAALTILNEIKRRNLLHNVLVRSIQIEKGLNSIAKEYSNIIKGHRGIGLLQGIVLNEEIIDAKKITISAFEKGLLVVPAGENVVRIVPPLIISKNEMNMILKKLSSIFKEL